MARKKRVEVVQEPAASNNKWEALAAAEEPEPVPVVVVDTPPVVVESPPVVIVEATPKQAEEDDDTIECLSKENRKETLELLKDYRSRSLSEILLDVDIDVDTKKQLVEIYRQLSWIEDAAQCVLDAALANQWEIARTIVDFMNVKDHWKVLRKLIGNWVSFRNRRAVRDVCVYIISVNPRAMPTLNEWAKEHGKTNGRIVKGYCDLCQGDNKQFAMQYSEL